MSTSKQAVSLEVRTQDAATEIYVIDGQFRLVARGLGTLTERLKPGIYKIKVRAGFTDREELVVLKSTDEEVIKEFPRLEFASPIPLDDTSRTHEYQTQAAASQCTTPHVNAGQGSNVYIFARDWTPTTHSPDSQPPESSRPAVPQHPAIGLTLIDEQGKVVANCEEQSVTNLSEARSRPGVDPWAACNVQLDPGLYKLRLELASGILEQTIVAVEGWQTQVFLLQRSYGSSSGKAEWKADLSGGSILLSKLSSSTPFDPGSDQLRLVELARLGLTNQRQVLPKDQVREMLWAKYDNPMLGIYGAHLMLLGTRPDLDLLRSVVSNLRGLIGTHPDVESLALRLPNETPSYVFSVPPMLRRSWSLVLDGSIKHPSLVPADSLASQVATKTWGDDPWLLWMRPLEEPGASDAMPGFDAGRSLGGQEDADELSGYEQALKAHLTSTAGSLLGSSPSRGLEGPVEHGSQDAVSSGSAVPPGFSTEIPPEGESAALPTTLDDSTAQTLVRVLGIPRGNVQGLLDRLNKGG